MVEGERGRRVVGEFGDFIVFRLGISKVVLYRGRGAGVFYVVVGYGIYLSFVVRFSFFGMIFIFFILKFFLMEKKIK